MSAAQAIELAHRHGVELEPRGELLHYRADAQLENWRLRQRVELSTTRGSDDTPSTSSSPRAVVLGPSASPGPYERVQSGNGVVRLRLKPVEVVQLPDDGVDDLW